VSRLTVPRMLATGALVTSATGVRVGAGCLELLVDRGPKMARRAVSASVGNGEGGTAEAAFRDDLLALAREYTEVSWRELRRGVDELDALTRTDDEAEVPHRPYRAKP
jgi:hypothetical protein